MTPETHQSAPKPDWHTGLCLGIEERIVRREPTNRTARALAYVLGMLEFRLSLTTGFYDEVLMETYDAGRDRGHALTLRRFEA